MPFSVLSNGKWTAIILSRQAAKPAKFDVDVRPFFKSSLKKGETESSQICHADFVVDIFPSHSIIKKSQWFKNLRRVVPTADKSRMAEMIRYLR